MPLSPRNQTLLTGLAILIVLGGLMFLGWKSFRPYRVPSGAMAPAIPPGSFVFVDDFAYSSPDQVQRGDVIVFTTPESYSRQTRQASSVFIFRVLGLPGDFIDFDAEDNYTVNGVAIELASRGDKTFERQTENWYEISAGGSRPLDRGPSLVVSENFPLEIPPGHFFVSGDNRANALDSRFWGTVPFDLIRGRARVD